MSSLSARLLIIMTIALLPALGLQIYAESRARQMRHDMMREESLRLLHQVRSEQQRIVEGAEQVATVLANAPEVREPIPDLCDRLMADLLRDSPRYSYASAIRPDGAPFCTPTPEGHAVRGGDRPWFRAAMRTGAFTVGEYTIGRVSGVPTIQFVRPFRDANGTIAGAVVLGLSLRWLNQQLERLTLPPGAIVSVSDRAGTMLARFPDGAALIGTAQPPGRQAWSQGDRIQSFEHTPSLDAGRPMFVTVSPPGADPHGLMVAVALDEETMFAGITRENHINLVLIVAGACSALLLAALTGGRLIRRPVNRLLRAADHWRSGDLGARTGLVHGRDEFGRLANAFDDMAGSLETRASALEKSEERLRLAMEAARMGVRELDLVSGKGSWSREAVRVLGCEADDDPSYDTWLRKVHPDDRAAVLAEWDRALADPAHNYNAEYRFAQPDGSWRWIGAHGRAIFEDGRPRRGMVVMQDITERKRVEAALRENEARLRLSQEAGRIGSWDWDLQTGVLHWSELQCRQFGVDPALGQSITFDMWRRVVHPDDLPMMEAKQCDDLVSGQSSEIDYRIVIDGQIRWMHARSHVFRDASGVPVRKTGIDMDITERRALEDELRCLTASLETRVREEVAAREAAQSRAAHAERMQALGQLAGGIAHDMNNVLQAAAGSLALIRRRAGDLDAIRRFTQLGTDAIERGASITGRLLAFGRRGDLRVEPIDVLAMLRGLQEILTYTLGAGIELIVSVPDDLPAVVTDKGQLETALVNLATNARDAMPGGGRLVFLAEARDIPAGEKAGCLGVTPGRYIRLAVSDTGNGMDAATLARAREPFFTTKTLGAGTGLGLPMALGFAEQSGGAMTIESQPAHGTTVALWLPIAPASPTRASPTPALPTRAQPGNPIAAKPAAARVLLVDDEAAVRLPLAGCLEDAGYAVLAAASGLEALDLLDGGETVDALVTDLSMPGMDGVKLIAAVRERFTRIPAILLTGYAADIAGAGVGDAVSLLRKPVDDVQLLDSLAALLVTREGAVA